MISYASEASTKLFILELQSINFRIFSFSEMISKSFAKSYAIFRLFWEKNLALLCKRFFFISKKSDNYCSKRKLSILTNGNWDRLSIFLKYQCEISKTCHLVFSVGISDLRSWWILSFNGRTPNVNSGGAKLHFAPPIISSKKSFSNKSWLNSIKIILFCLNLQKYKVNHYL